MAKFKQVRDVELVSGANQAFLITNAVIEANVPVELPHLSVFVVNIVDDADPKQDALARVASLADLTSIPVGRDPGIVSPGPDGKQFLAASWTASYSTLETGLDAAKAFRDRVNQLILDWSSFRTNFNAPDPTPAIYTFPAVDASQKTVLIAAYKAAKQDRYQKQITKTDADAALTRAATDSTYKQSLVSSMATLVSGATQNISEMSSLSGFFATLQAAGSTFLSANPGGVGAAAFTTALSPATVQNAQAAAFLADASALATGISSYQSARQTDVTAAQAALSTATTDQATKAQQLVSALALEASQLAAVLAVCPDFDKHSIPFVDDTEP